jgi:HlyD family secretion protein
MLFIMQSLKRSSFSFDSSRLLVCSLVSLLFSLGACSKSGGAKDELKVSGNIEVVDAQVGFKISGRVAERLVSEGNKVKTGQLVARLDDEEQREQLALRKAELAAAESALADLLAGSRPQEIATAEAVVRSAQANRELSRLDFIRQRELLGRKVITLREYEVAEAALRVADAKVAETEENLKLVREGARKEVVQQARAHVEEAKAYVALAQTQLDNTRLVSPLDGVVLSHTIEAGEYVSPGTPILSVADTLNLWVRAYIAQTDLGRVKLGQKVQVQIDSFGGKTYEGRVGFIASDAEFTPKTVQTTKERVKLVYRVKVYVTNTQDELKPGMPADIVFP